MCWYWWVGRIKSHCRVLGIFPFPLIWALLDRTRYEYESFAAPLLRWFTLGQIATAIPGSPEWGPEEWHMACGEVRGGELNLWAGRCHPYTASPLYNIVPQSCACEVSGYSVWADLVVLSWSGMMKCFKNEIWQLREENKTDFPEQCNGTRQQLHLKEILQGAMLFLKNQYLKNLLNEVHNFLFEKTLRILHF